MQRFILSLILAILPSIATAGGVCSSSLFIEAAQFPAGVSGNAVAVGLINNDAIPDLAVVGDGELSILLGQGGGAFDPPILTQLFNSTLSVTTGHFDGDSLLDVAVGEFGQVLILFGHGDGTFEPPAIFTTNGGSIATIVAATLDANASLDLAMADSYYGNVVILLNNGDGTFQTANTISGEGVTDLTVGDFGGDGILDIASLNSPNGTFSLFTGFGNGDFGPPSDFVAGTNLVGMAAGYFDGDAILDLVTSTQGFVSVILGNGNGTFQAALLFPTGLQPGRVAVADIDLDGFTDIVLASSTPGRVAVLRGLGDGGFGPAEAYLSGDSTFGLAVSDLNGDGLPDVATADKTNQSISIILDQQDGSLFAAPLSPVAAGGFASQLVQADFDGNGRPDFAWIESFQNSVVIVLGGLHGRFVQAPLYFSPNGQISGITAGDFTGDAKADLVITDFSGAFLAPGLGDGTFGDVVSIYSSFNQLTEPVAADFDGDGELDFIVPEGCCGGANLQVFLGNGDATFQGPFTTVVQGNLTVLLVTPLRGGNTHDLVVRNGLSLVFYPGNGDGTFGSPETILTDPSGSVFSVAAGEFNGDGTVDLLVTQQSATVTLLLGNGDGTFGPPILIGLPSSAIALATSDFDADGALDFVVLANDLLVFRGIGNGHFQSPLAFMAPDGSSLLATGDFDGNGQPDLVSGSGNTLITHLNSALGAVVHDVSVIVGSPAVLEASASGFGAVTYQWRKDGVPLADGGPISGSQTATLTIDPAAFTDGGSYDVVVTDSCTNATSNSATLAVEFDDVPLSNPFHDDILTIATLGITGGCTDTSYCPTNPVSRAEMAVFLLKAKFGAGHVPPPPPPVPTFPDVPANAFAAAWIEELASLGITAGCGNGNYCPDASVTRAEMAVFLLKTLLGSGYVPPDPAGIFADVAPNNFAIAWIEDLFNRGVTAGCGTNPLIYCPDAAVPREQMATFLVRTFLGP